MDILIPNMEMPKNYPYRLTLHSDGHIEDHSGYSGHGHYQAIPVPEHNDLADKSVIIERMGEVYEALYDKVDNKALSECHVAFLKAVMYAPTVIPSSEVVLERTT